MHIPFICIYKCIYCYRIFLYELLRNHWDDLTFQKVGDSLRPPVAISIALDSSGTICTILSLPCFHLVPALSPPCPRLVTTLSPPCHHLVPTLPPPTLVTNTFTCISLILEYTHFLYIYIYIYIYICVCVCVCVIHTYVMVYYHCFKIL